MHIDNEKSRLTNSDDSKWYNNAGTLFLSLVFFFPAFFYGLYKTKLVKKKIKPIIIILLILLSCIPIVAGLHLEATAKKLAYVRVTHYHKWSDGDGIACLVVILKSNPEKCFHILEFPPNKEAAKALDNPKFNNTGYSFIFSLDQAVDDAKKRVRVKEHEGSGAPKGLEDYSNLYNAIIAGCEDEGLWESTDLYYDIRDGDVYEKSSGEKLIDYLGQHEKIPALQNDNQNSTSSFQSPKGNSHTPPKKQEEIAPETLNIGDSFGGGIVAYILQPCDPGYDVSVLHVLIAAPNDQNEKNDQTRGEGISWGGSLKMETDARRYDIGTGLANTNGIIASLGEGDYAAWICHSLKLGGYNDWYLPSKDELNKLYINRKSIGGFAGDLYHSMYWSSSEWGSDRPWSQDFHKGGQTNIYAKDWRLNVRAVRSFSQNLKEGPRKQGRGDSAKLIIGQSYGGGVIAYILQPGDPRYDVSEQHGLIAATSDQSKGIQWYNGDWTKTLSTSGGTSTAIGTGRSNTIKALKQGKGNYAASICNVLVLGGYSDWYLPSKDELDKLCVNKKCIGGFDNAPYWSSSEDANNYTWYQNFVPGDHSYEVDCYQSYDYKDAQKHVRAVRSF